MNLTFSKESSVAVTKNCDPGLVCRIGSALVLDPEIIDGMGEKLVGCDCNNCTEKEYTRFAEIIVLRWKNNGNYVEKSFSGYDSYLIQNMIHKLESSSQEEDR